MFFGTALVQRSKSLQKCMTLVDFFRANAAIDYEKTAFHVFSES